MALLDKRSVDPSSLDSDAYQCNPGLCAIINNMRLEPILQNDLRNEKDETRLKVIFTLLGFSVKVYHNLTAADMESTIERYSKMEHKGAFFLIICSHGGEGDVVYGTDGGEVKVHDLENHFSATNCPSLASMPKVFMIDACRGTEEERAHLSNTRVEDSADIMTIFASTRNHTANCNRDEGSFFIEAFAKVLKETSADEHLTDMMKKVIRNIQKKKIQIPKVKSTFSKSYYITRGSGLNAFLKLEKEVQEAVDQWIPVREKKIKEIREVAECLEGIHRKVNMSRIVGSAISIVGTVLAVFGLALISVSMNECLTLAIFGMVLSSLGGTIVAFASIAEIVLEKWKMRGVDKKKEEDSQLKDVQEKIEKMESIVEAMQLSTHTSRINRRKRNSDSRSKTCCEIISSAISDCLKEGSDLFDGVEDEILKYPKLALRVGGAIATGSSIVLNVILLPMNIYEIKQSSSNLESGSTTYTIKMLMKDTADLRNKMISIKEKTNKLIMDASFFI